MSQIENFQDWAAQVLTRHGYPMDAKARPIYIRHKAGTAIGTARKVPERPNHEADVSDLTTDLLDDLAWRATRLNDPPLGATHVFLEAFVRGETSPYTDALVLQLPERAAPVSRASQVSAAPSSERADVAAVQAMREMSADLLSTLREQGGQIVELARMQAKAFTEQIEEAWGVVRELERRRGVDEGRELGAEEALTAVAAEVDRAGGGGGGGTGGGGALERVAALVVEGLTAVLGGAVGTGPTVDPGSVDLGTDVVDVPADDPQPDGSSPAPG